MKSTVITIILVLVCSYTTAIPIENNHHQRDVSDFIINTLGLGSVWDEIKGVGANAVATLISEGMQLLFAGKEVINQAKEIFSQLVSDLTNHTASASTLVNAAIAQVGQILNSKLNNSFKILFLNK